MGTTTTFYGLYKPAFDEEGWDDEINATMDAIDTALNDLATTTGVDIHSGTGVPSAGLGNDGDIYFRSNGGFYDKVAGAWVLQFTLPGSTGATGASFLSGTGAPSGGTGANGDTYLATDTGAVYGPKASGVWPASTSSLLGPQGTAGPTAEVKVTVPNAGATETLDCNDGSFFRVTLTADCTISITGNDTPVPVCSVMLIQSGAGSWEVTWADDIAWPGGTAPTLSTAPGSIDTLTFFYDEETDQWIAGNAIIGSEAPAPTLPTLALTTIFTISGAAGAADASQYTSAESANGGTQGMILVAVATTQDTVDPLTPILAGGGMTTWVQLDEARVFDTAGATRRILTLWGARQATPGAAAPLTVTYRSGNSPGGTLTPQNGVALVGVKVEGTPPGTGLNTALTAAVGDSANAVTGGTGGNSTSPALTFGTAGDTDHRFIVFLAGNLTATLTTDWTALSGADITHSSPTVILKAVHKAATDTTFTGTLSAANTFAMIGTELEQG